MSGLPPFYDPDDDLSPSAEELRRAEEIKQLRAAGKDPDAAIRGRSAADDILDAVAEAPARPAVPKTHCPLCGSASKKRSSGVGAGTVTRRCTNPKCRNEWPAGQQMDRTEPYRDMPPAPTSRGPYEGEGGPPIDKHQPIRRRLAEHIRRARDHEP